MADETATIIATFAVYAGTTVEFDLDVTGMTDEQIADAVRDEAAGHLDTQLCHECCRRVVDPQAEEMTGLQVDDREIDLEALASPTEVVQLRAQLAELTARKQTVVDELKARVGTQQVTLQRHCVRRDQQDAEITRLRTELEMARAGLASCEHLLPYGHEDAQTCDQPCHPSTDRCPQHDADHLAYLDGLQGEITNLRDQLKGHDVNYAGRDARITELEARDAAWKAYADGLAQIITSIGFDAWRGVDKGHDVLDDIYQATVVPPLPDVLAETPAPSAPAEEIQA